jgi:cell division protein FtsW (lipid II flippase)
VNKFFKLDWIMMTAVVLLLAIGMVALYSISYEGAYFNSTNFNKQLLSSALGLILLFFLSFYDYRAIGSYSTKLYFVALAVLELPSGGRLAG